MLEKTRELDPFSNQGRSLQSYKGINANPIYSVNKEKFHHVVLRTAQRLRRDRFLTKQKKTLVISMVVIVIVMIPVLFLSDV